MKTNTSKSTMTNSADCENCWLNNFPAFKDCSPEARNEICNNLEVKKYSRGEYLIQSGDEGDRVFCIKDGNVKVSKKGNSNKEFILWIAHHGDMVGLNSLIDEGPFAFSASAINEVTACFIHAADLKIILQKEPVFSMQLMKTLCEKLNFIEQRITSISRKKIKERSAEILINLATRNGQDTNMQVDYSINDLASLVGTTKNYLYKVILELTSKKILLVQKRKIIINNYQALSSIAIGKEK